MAYTSNYTDEDSAKGEVLDFVFVIGADNPGKTTQFKDYKKTIADCEAKHLKYAILGDGKSSVNFTDIDKLPKARNLVINAHGGVLDGKHFISLKQNSISSSCSLITKIQKKTQAQNILCSTCFGGKIIDDFKNNKDYKLDEGTIITAYSAPDEATLALDTSRIITTVINQTNPGKVAPIISLVRDIIKTIPQTIVIACQLKDEMLSETLLRKSRGLNEVNLEVKRFCEYQLSIYINFLTQLINVNAEGVLDQLKNEYPDFNIDEYKSKPIPPEEISEFIKLEMTDEEEHEFQERSFNNHVFHNDVKIIKDMLEKLKIQFETVHLVRAILFNFQDLVTILLKHMDKSSHRQMIDAYIPPNDSGYTLGGHADFTPLTLALFLEEPAIVKTLIRYGADINLPDKHGRIPANMLKDIDLTLAPLSNAKLSNVNLTSAKLESADLTHAILIKTILIEANLSHALLLHADLKEADLSRAILKNANLSNANLMSANLTDVDLTKTILTRTTNLAKANLTRTNLKQSDLTLFDLSDVILTAANLEEIKLIQATLVRANLSEAILNNAKLMHANLSEANLAGAKLNGADFSNANLSGAILTGVDLTNTILTNANLSRADLSLANLSNIDFSSININGVNFTTATLTGADLSEKNLSDVDMMMADLTNADLGGADLTGADLQRAILINANLSQAILTNATLSGADMTWANLSGVNLMGFNLSDVILTRANLAKANLALAILKKNNLQGVNLEGATLASANLSGAILSDAKMTGADMRGIDLTEAVLTKANLTNARLTGADLARANLTGANLEGVDLKNADLTNADLTGVNLRGADLTGVDLRSVKGLNLQQLISTASLRNTHIDIKQFNGLSNMDQVKLKQKIIDEYVNYMGDEKNNISAITNQLVDIIKSGAQHPLKFNNTSAYTKVIDSGVEKLISLLNPQTFTLLDKETKSRLQLISRQVPAQSGSVMTFFSPKTSTDKLSDVMHKLESANLAAKIKPDNQYR